MNYEPDAEELRAAVHEVVAPILAATRAVYGPIPGVRTEAWWSAPPPVRLAGVLVLALAWTVHDPQLAVADRFKQMAVDLSQANDWTAEARRPSHAELRRGRGETAA